MLQAQLLKVHLRASLGGHASMQSLRGISLPCRIASETRFRGNGVTSAKRHLAGISNVSSWFQDVMKTGSLRPSNPILSSLESDGDPKLPEFHRILPYHLESATSETFNQYKVNLAELEVSLTGVPEGDVSDTSLLERLDAMEAPITHILELGRLYCELASPPDQLKAWEEEYQKATRRFNNLPWRNSTIIYKNLPSDVPVPMKTEYRRRGAHERDPESREELKNIEGQLQDIRARLRNTPSYSTLMKNQRLQLVSDLYNWVGYSKFQADKLGYSDVSELARDSSPYVSTPEEILSDIVPEVASMLRPYLPTAKASLNANVGAFLKSDGDQATPASEDELQAAKAKWQVQKYLHLHGVLQGVADFFDAMFAIRVEYEANAGWNPNVRLLHLFDNETDEALGSIYLDPFQDSYWRSEQAKELVSSRPLARRKNQSQLPLAIVSLNIKPTWDDAPTPMSWDDTRDLLYEMGSALQLLLTQSKCAVGEEPPRDVSEFLGTFMETWIQNDGFLQRLAQLSQNEHVFDEKEIEVLRKDLRKEKAAEIMESAFLGCLDLAIWRDFDPRGEESLSSLQAQIAREYLPHHSLESDDAGSFVLELAKLEDKSVPYKVLYSEVLAAMVYDKFQTTDLRNREEVERLGKGIRDLFLKGGALSKNDFEELCGQKISTSHLMSVYKF